MNWRALLAEGGQGEGGADAARGGRGALGQRRRCGSTGAGRRRHPCAGAGCRPRGSTGSMIRVTSGLHDPAIAPVASGGQPTLRALLVGGRMIAEDGALPGVDLAELGDAGARSCCATEGAGSRGLFPHRHPELRPGGTNKSTKT
ncbi:hypothetical protein ACTMU2_06270 [Cupriavidus basilensis]